MLNTILLQAANDGQGGYGSIIMIVALIAIFYFFMIRPQSQRQKKINEFRKGLSKGDKVMTAGGIHGVIKEIRDNNGTVLLKIDDGVVIVVEKSMIYQSAQDVAEVGANPQNEAEAK